MSDDILVAEVKASGRCVTRNGECAISSVRLELSGNTAKLGCVSSKLSRMLHTGISLDAVAMDRLSLAWILKRGLAGGSGFQSRIKAVSLLRSAEVLMSEAVGLLGGDVNSGG